MASTTSYSGKRTDLGPLMDRVTKKREEAIITRENGEPVVMLSLDEWSSINETLHVLSSREYIEVIRDSLKRLENKADIRKSREKIDVVRSNRNGGMTERAALRTFRLCNKKNAARARLPEQAQVILETIGDLGGEASKRQIVNNLTKNGLQTRQEPKRIFDFYCKRLVEEGYMKETNATSVAS